MAQGTNTIPKEQNSNRQLDRLAARSYLYSQANLVVVIETIFTVLTPLVSALLVAVFSDLKAWAAIAGLTMLLIDAAVLDQHQKTLKRQSAKIQELFDCDVMGLKWHTLHVGPRPEGEFIREQSNKVKKKDPELSKLKNWYPEAVGKVSLPLARLICQRANLWWNSKLRRHYAQWIAICLLILAPVVFAIGLYGGMSLEKFVLAVFAPLSPAFVWGIREYRRQTDSADALDRLRTHSEELWAKAIKGNFSDDELALESRDLQDEIYERRQSDPLIFEPIYWLFRSEYEDQMVKGADDLIDEALR